MKWTKENLPTWQGASEAIANGISIHPVADFIYNYEPVECHDEKFRGRLIDALNFAAITEDSDVQRLIAQRDRLKDVNADLLESLEWILKIINNQETIRRILNVDQFDFIMLEFTSKLKDAEAAIKKARGAK